MIAQFETQILANLPAVSELSRLFLLPTCGTRFFQYDAGSWTKVYSEDLTATEKERIIRSLERAVATAGFTAARIWGALIEDRGSQVTYSALGQQAPLREKQEWDSDFGKRKAIKAILDPMIPEFTVRLGGATSIDVTKPGIDKAYGIAKLIDILGVGIPEMLFVGDALFPDGNDYPAKEAGVECIQVRDPDETKRVIEAIVACLPHRETASG